LELLNSGELEDTGQLHSLEVTFNFKDGSEVYAIDPRIDAIFDGIDRSGAPSSDNLMATE